jgi:hypothetical protein
VKAMEATTAAMNHGCNPDPALKVKFTRKE